MLDASAFDRLYRPGAFARKAWDFARAGTTRLAQVIAAAHADVVLVHREVWPLAGMVHEEVLRGCNPRFVFDLDDAVYLPNVSQANRSVGFLKSAGKSAWLARHAAAVSAGNRFLADWAVREGADAKDVFLVPTAVDTDAWRPGPGPSGPPTLGWIGSHSTVGYLDPLRPTFAELGRRVPGIRLRVIGAAFACPGIEVESVPWSLATEVDALAGVTVGLAPLPDDEWSRGKCGLKVLQYMALEKPVVSSRVGANADIVVEGVTGLFADGESAWLEAVTALLGSASDRSRMGRAGRERVEREYSLRATEPRLAQALLHAAGVLA